MSKRRPALGSDPFDALLSVPTPAPRPTVPERTRTARPASSPDIPPPPAPAGRPSRKVKTTYLLPPELVEEARDAAVALSGPPLRLTLAALVENALRHELGRLRDEHMKGKPFPKHGAPLVGGRPIKG